MSSQREHYSQFQGQTGSQFDEPDEAFEEEFYTPENDQDAGHIGQSDVGQGGGGGGEQIVPESRHHGPH